MEILTRVRRAAIGIIAALLLVATLVPASAAQAAPGLTPVTRLGGDPIDGAVWIRWAEPLTPNTYRWGSGALTTTITAEPGGASCTVPTDRWLCKVTGLTNYQDYTFTAVTVDPDGDSATTTPSIVVAPRDDLWEPAVEDTALSTTRMPAQGGDLVVTLHITDAPSGLAGLPRLWLRSGSSETPVVEAGRVSGTANDGVYQATFPIPAGPPWGWSVLREALTDNVGNTGWSAYIGSVELGRPQIPTGITAELRPGRVIRVGWNRPPDDTGIPLLGYRIFTTSGVPVATAGPDATSADVEVGDAHPGVRPQYVVTAYNASGQTDWSTPTVAVAAPPAEPGAPTSPRLTSSRSIVDVGWERAAAHGSPVLRYIVTAEPGGVVCTNVDPYCRLTDLPRRVPVRLAVAAVNAIGTGPSLALGQVTLNDSPTKPSAPSAEIRGTTMYIAWSPTEWGGERGYYAVDTVPWTDGCTAAQGTFCEIRWVDPDIQYEVRVRAVNSVGTSPQSDPVRASVYVPPVAAPVVNPTPAPDVAKAPAPVTKPKVDAQPGRARVSWSAPKTRGAKITGYRVTVQHGSKKQHFTVAAKTRSLQVKKLKKGVTYKVTIVALSEGGASKTSVARSFRAR